MVNYNLDGYCTCTIFWLHDVMCAVGCRAWYKASVFFSIAKGMFCMKYVPQ